MLGVLVQLPVRLAGMSNGRTGCRSVGRLLRLKDSQPLRRVRDGLMKS